MKLSVDYKGRIKREEFWNKILNLILLSGTTFLPFVLLFFMFTPSRTQISIILSIFVLTFIWPLASIYVKRLHDIGLSGWLFICVFIPIIFSRIADIFIVLTIILGLIKSSTKDNKYGKYYPTVDITMTRVERPNFLFSITMAMGLALIFMVISMLGSSMYPKLL